MNRTLCKNTRKLKSPPPFDNYKKIPPSELFRAAKILVAGVTAK